MNDKFEMRKSEYIKCLRILARYGYKDPYIIEALKGRGPTFLDYYSKNIFYSKAHDFSIKDIRNKGINEAKTILDGLNHFNFHPNDMLLKLTGRYHLKSDNFIKLVNNNPHVDIFVKAIYNKTMVITGCFAMRCCYFKDMLEKLDYKTMEKNFIYLETKVMDYIRELLKIPQIKVMFVDELDVSAYVMGAGQYVYMQL